MTHVRIDHNMAGHADLLWALLVADGWPELLAFRFVRLPEVGLRAASSDRAIWRVIQVNDMVLLTLNRNGRAADSLQRVLAAEGTPSTIPVLTVSSVKRLDESAYRKRCADRLVEILFDIDHHRGAGRIFIPQAARRRVRRGGRGARRCGR